MSEYIHVDASGTTHTRRVSIAALAAHLLRDFKPWLPLQARTWLVDMMDAFLDLHPPNGGSAYITRDDLSSLESQWKPVVSWLLGTVFCRESACVLGYPFVVPVSVLEGGANGHQRAAWNVVPSSMLSVVRVSPGLTPDYVAFDGVPGAGRACFFEAKGTSYVLDTHHLAGGLSGKLRLEWMPQVRNAELKINGISYDAGRYVVATRVNSRNVSPGCRRIEVREWTDPSVPVGSGVGGASGMPANGSGLGTAISVASSMAGLGQEKVAEAISRSAAARAVGGERESTEDLLRVRDAWDKLDSVTVHGKGCRRLTSVKGDGDRRKELLFAVTPELHGWVDNMLDPETDGAVSPPKTSPKEKAMVREESEREPLAVDGVVEDTLLDGIVVSWKR